MILASGCGGSSDASDEAIGSSADERRQLLVGLPSREGPVALVDLQQVRSQLGLTPGTDPAAPIGRPGDPSETEAQLLRISTIVLPYLLGELEADSRRRYSGAIDGGKILAAASNLGRGEEAAFVIRTTQSFKDIADGLRDSYDRVEDRLVPEPPETFAPDPEPVIPPPRSLESDAAREAADRRAASQRESVRLPPYDLIRSLGGGVILFQGRLLDGADDSPVSRVERRLIGARGAALISAPAPATAPCLDGLMISQNYGPISGQIVLESQRRADPDDLVKGQLRSALDGASISRVEIRDRALLADFSASGFGVDPLLSAGESELGLAWRC